MRRDCRIDHLAKNLAVLKKEFAVVEYGRTGHIHEVIPSSESERFPIDSHDLRLLHRFAGRNPIYYNSFEETIGGTPCIVYEGDINRYWLNSIQHNSSRAPFSPTWIMSAYVGSLFVKELGYGEAVDVGSGDGRIAFCSRVAGMESYSIEVDEMLAGIQNGLSAILDFHPFCSDAVSFDYSVLDLKRPVFFIGGLAQMGGGDLAAGVIDKMSGCRDAGWVLAGTYSQKYRPDPKGKAGWGTFIEENGLELIRTVSLPTAWTFDESDDTPYVFVRTLNNSNPN